MTPPCTASQHTEFRSLLGSLNWLQSRTQFAVCYNFSRAASASAGPKIGDIRSLNKIVRTIRAKPQRLIFHDLKGKLRLIGYPDASYRNNADTSSQRGQVIFLAEPKISTLRGQPPAGGGDSRGSLVEYESTKIRRTTLSTTVA